MPRFGHLLRCNIAFNSGRSPSSQQRSEARLLKMTVVRERFGEARIAHHHKRNAIRERPLLVLATGEEVISALKQLLRNRNDTGVRVLLEPRVEFRKLSALGSPTHRIGDLQQNETRGETRSGNLPAQGDRRLVQFVVGIQRGEEEGRVGEDGLHRFGVP